MSEHILKRHNKTLILYHIVCPVKYRQKVFTEKVERSLQNICIEIGKRYEIHFVEIGTDKDHVHFLVQSVPAMSPSSVVQIIRALLQRRYSNIIRRSRNCYGAVNSGRADSISTPLGNMAMKPSSKSMSKTKEKPINRYTTNSWNYLKTSHSDDTSQLCCGVVHFYKLFIVVVTICSICFKSIGFLI